MTEANPKQTRSNLLARCLKQNEANANPDPDPVKDLKTPPPDLTGDRARASDRGGDL